MILFLHKKNCLGQSFMEFTALMMIIVGALISVQMYFKRGVQGRWKSAVEEMTEELYDPRFTESNMLYQTKADSVVEIFTATDSDGKLQTIRTDRTNSTDTRHGYTAIGGYFQE